MSTYTCTVPPTKEQGSYKTTVRDSYGSTYRQDALRDYNSARAHDGLPPIARMPAGTAYHRHYVYTIQQYTSHGWEYVNVETTRKEALRSLKEYRDNQPEFPARICRKAS